MENDSGPDREIEGKRPRIGARPPAKRDTAPVHAPGNPVRLPGGAVRVQNPGQSGSILPPLAYVPPDQKAKEVAAGTKMDPAERERLMSAIDSDPKIRTEVITPPKNIVCNLCRAWYRAEVEKRYSAGESPVVLAQIYGVGVNLIKEHMTHLAASAKMEANVESVSNEIAIWRDRAHELYATVAGMLEVLRSGFVKEIDKDGNIILCPMAIRDIKPTMDVMLKTITAGQSLAETFAKVHKLYVDTAHTGPIFQVTYVNLEQPTGPVVVMDSPPDAEEKIENLQVRYMAGQKIINTSELPTQKQVTELVAGYLENGTISGKEYAPTGQTRDYTTPGEPVE